MNFDNMFGKEYSIGRFMCDHPFITLSICSSFFGVIKYGLYLKAVKDGLPVTTPGGMELHINTDEPKSE